jgi:hypothetical protein
MSRRITTCQQINESQYPSLQVYWVEDNPGRGFVGDCMVYINPSARVNCNPLHVIHVIESSHVGVISFHLDLYAEESGPSGSIHGVEVTIRDLQFITAWAALAIEVKHLKAGRKFTEGCRECGKR